MKHSTLSKYPLRATCLFFMRSSISSLSLKIFGWCFPFVSSRACIWLSRSVIACWCSSCFFSMSFLVKATAFGVLDHAAISIEPSKLMKISWGLFVFLREGARPPAFRSDLWWKCLKLCLMSSMPKYFPRSALLNKCWFLSSELLLEALCETIQGSSLS